MLVQYANLWTSLLANDRCAFATQSMQRVNLFISRKLVYGSTDVLSYPFWGHQGRERYISVTNLN